jgi:hypothetical protein
MDVVMAVLADSANISREGKLNILGIFDVLNATSFPVVHPQMQLVIKFEAHSAEAGKKRKLDIKFMDDDGKSVFELHGELTLGGPARSGEPFKFDHILSLNGLRFEKPGTYEFKIYVEGEAKKEVPLRVIKLASPSPPG